MCTCFFVLALSFSPVSFLVFYKSRTYVICNWITLIKKKTHIAHSPRNTFLMKSEMRNKKKKKQAKQNPSPPNTQWWSHTVSGWLLCLLYEWECFQHFYVHRVFDHEFYKLQILEQQYACTHNYYFGTQT